MHAESKSYVPWRDRAFVSIKEAGSILARSPDWVRHRIGEGRLEAYRLIKGGPALVSVESLIRLIDATASRVGPIEFGRPRLVVDNS